MFCEKLAAMRQTVDSPATLHAVLSKVASSVEHLSMSAWSKNLSHGVGHHSGWLPLLQRVGFLRKARRSASNLHASRSSARGARKVMHLGEGKQPYTIVLLRGNPLLHKKLQQILNLNSISMKPPRTWREWSEGLQELMKSFKEQPALTGPAHGYSQLWLARSYMFLLRMRLSAARSKLHVTHNLGKMSVKQFASMAPDQGAWVTRFCGRAGVAKTLQELNYRGPLELFSMKLCLYSNQHLTWGSEQVRQHHKLLKRLLGNYITEHGLAPHPAVLQSIAMQALLDDPRRSP